jgi:hypothetical protein
MGINGIWLGMGAAALSTSVFYTIIIITTSWDKEIENVKERLDENHSSSIENEEKLLPKDT